MRDIQHEYPRRLLLLDNRQSHDSRTSRPPDRFWCA